MGKSKTHEQFVKEIFELVGDEYTVLEEYKGCKNEILFKHNLCNNIFYKTPDNFKHRFNYGCACNICAEKIKRRKLTKTNEQFIQEVYNLVGNEYTFLEEYKSARTNILIRHNKCGHKYNVSPDNFLRGYRCPKCNKGVKRTENEFKEEIYELTKGEYDVIGKYLNADTKILMRHNCKECNNYEWKIRPYSFMAGTRCPLCQSSKGEKQISKWLVLNEFIKVTYEEYILLSDIEKKINKYYIPQKEFDGLIGLGGGNLSYDFYLPKYNLLIEYQGIQHEKPIDFKNEGMEKAKERFKQQKIHDALKKYYAKEHNIKLIPIWYWDYNNIEIILDKKLNIKEKN